MEDFGIFLQKGTQQSNPAPLGPLWDQDAASFISYTAPNNWGFDASHPDDLITDLRVLVTAIISPGCTSPLLLLQMVDPKLSLQVE